MLIIPSQIYFLSNIKNSEPADVAANINIPVVPCCQIDDA